MKIGPRKTLSRSPEVPTRNPFSAIIVGRTDISCENVEERGRITVGENRETQETETGGSGTIIGENEEMLRKLASPSDEVFR